MAGRKKSRRFGSVFRRRSRSGGFRPGYYIAFPYRGRKVRKWGGPTATIAKERLSDVHAALSRGSGLDEAIARAFGLGREGCPTFRKAAKAYLDAGGKVRSRGGLSPAALADYGYKVDAVLRSAAFASRPVDEIAASDLAAWLEGKERDGMSAATYNRYLALFSGVFQWAKREGHLAANPARDVDRRSEKGHEREVFLDREQADHLIASAPDTDFADFLTLAVYAGLRRGALLALQWRDVALKDAEIRVRAETTKTRTARTVPMAAPVLKALERRYGARTNADGKAPVFERRDSPWTLHVVRHRWERTLGKATDLPGHLRDELRFHDLRHCFATFLINTGASLAVVAELMGHSIQHTTRRYAHLVPETKARAVAAMDAAF